MTPAPPRLPASPRAQHAERNVRLDPQGIYGTRSARRQNQLRRRRQFQNAVLWVLGALAMLAGMRWALQPRYSARSAGQTLQLPFRPASAPLALGNGELLFTSQSGGLWRGDTRAKTSSGASFSLPRRVWSSGFAPAAAPLVKSGQIFWPGGDGTLTALNAASGREMWRASLPSALVARPAWVQVAARAFVVAGDDHGHIAAFDARTGALQWRKVLGGALGAGIGVLEAPKSAEPTKAQAAIGGVPNGEAANGEAANGEAANGEAANGEVGDSQSPNAVAASVGATNAAANVGAGTVGAANIPAKRAGASILVPLMAGAGSRGGLVCLDARTGAVRWRFPGDERSQSAGTALPATLDGRVFWCNDEGAVLCLEGATGRKIWKSFAAPAAANADQLVMLRGAPTLVEAEGVVVVGGNDGTLRAFELASGAPRWKRNLGGAVHFAAQNLRFEDKNALLATGEVPAILLLDARDGSLLRRWATPHPNSYGVAFTLENAYALDAEGHLQIAALQ